MSVFNGSRLPPEVFKLDTERLPRGWYSDKYFLNTARLLGDLARNDYRFARVAPRFVNTFDDLEVEAVQDGVILPYGGDPRDVLPVLHVRAAIATSPPWRPLSWAP